MKLNHRTKGLFRILFPSRFALHTSRSFGFTMIELLVVIAIIGILVAVGVASFGTAQKGTRDSRRKQDIKTIQTAMEQYFGEGNIYPLADANIETSVYFQSAKYPLDPKNTGTSKYTVKLDATNGSGYCACALLEKTGTGNADGVPASFDACPIVSTSSASLDYYCVKNIQ